MDVEGHILIALLYISQSCISAQLTDSEPCRNLLLAKSCLMTLQCNLRLKGIFAPISKTTVLSTAALTHLPPVPQHGDNAIISLKNVMVGSYLGTVCGSGSDHSNRTGQN